MIYRADSGCFVIASRDVWLPGCYADERTARYAFRFPNDVLAKLQDEANERNGGTDGVITYGDLQRARALRSAPTPARR